MSEKHPLIKDEELFFEKVKSSTVSVKYGDYSDQEWELKPITGMSPETLYVFVLYRSSNVFDFFITKYQKIPQAVDFYRIYKIESRGKPNSYKIEKIKTESIDNLPQEISYPARLLGKTDAKIQEFLTSQKPVTDHTTIINLKILILSRPDLSRETLKVLMEKYAKTIYSNDIRLITEFGGNKKIIPDFIEFFLEKIRNKNEKDYVHEQAKLLDYKNLFKHLAKEDLSSIKRVFDLLQSQNEKLEFLNTLINKNPKSAINFAIKLLRDQSPQVRDNAKRYLESLKS